MPIASPITSSFNGGMFSDLLAGHVNAPRRDSAVSLLQNLIPTVQGPATRRGGTRFAFEVKDSSKQTALLEFEFNVEQAFIIEMGDQYMRFYKDNAIITETAADIADTGITAATPPVVTTDSNHGYTTGDEVFIENAGGMVEVNQRSYHITVLSDTTFSLQDREDVDIVGAGYTAHTTGGTSAKIYEISTNYLQADLFDSDGHFEFRITQSNDVMYVAHKNYPLSTIIRTTDTSWAVAELPVGDGPYENINIEETELKPSGTTGTITMSVEEGELVTNGGFVTDTDWTKGTGWVIENNEANTGSGTATSDLEQPVTLVEGSTYTVTYQIIVFREGSITADLGGTLGVARTSGFSGPLSEDIVAGSANTFKLTAAAFGGRIDNVSIVLKGSLTVNGVFAADTDWTKGTDWTIGSGVATVGALQTGDSSLSQNQAVIEGRSYSLVYTISSYTAGTMTPHIGGTAATARTAAGTFTETIKAGSGADPKLEMRADVDGDFSIDDVSLTLIPKGINDDSGFLSTDVGRIMRFRDSANNWTWMQIVAVNSITSVTATIKGPDLATTDAGNEWQLGLWSTLPKYPSAVWLYQRRLVTGTDDRVDMTQINGFTDVSVNFGPSDPDGTVNADNAISLRLGANQVNDILWIADHEKALLVGTASGEWVIRANTLGDAIAPDNITSDRATREGSAPTQALVAGNAVLFIQRARRKLHEMGFNFEADGFRSPDMTLLAEDVTNGTGGIVQMAYQQQPQSIVWIVRKDGILLGFTYERGENVLAWHRHIIGGSFSSGDAVVEHVASIPSADTSRDELWMIVKRTINSVTRRYVEYMTPLYDTSIDQEDAVHVDSSLAYSGSAVTTVRGLNHLEAEVIEIYNEGKAQPAATVAAGLITIPNSGTTTKAQIGLPNTWKLQTLEIEVAGPGNTMQGKPKRIDRVIARYLNTLGISISGDDVDYDDEEFTNFTNFGQMTALFSGDVEHRWPGDYDRKGKLYFKHSGPFPVTIQAIMPRVVTSDR